MVYQKKKTKGTKKTKGRKHLTQKQKQHVSQRVVVNVSVPQRKPPRKMGYNAPKQVKPSMTSFYGDAWHLQRPASNVYDQMFRGLNPVSERSNKKAQSSAYESLQSGVSSTARPPIPEDPSTARPPIPEDPSTARPPIPEDPPAPIPDALNTPSVVHTPPPAPTVVPGDASASARIPSAVPVPAPADPLRTSARASSSRRNLESHVPEDSEGESSLRVNIYAKLAGTHKFRKNNKVDWSGQGQAIQDFLGGQEGKTVQQSKIAYNNYKGRKGPQRRSS